MEIITAPELKHHIKTQLARNDWVKWFNEKMKNDFLQKSYTELTFNDVGDAIDGPSTIQYAPARLYIEHMLTMAGYFVRIIGNRMIISFMEDMQ